MRLFLIHWNQAEAEGLAAPLRDLGHEVEIEAEDGARAASRIQAATPDAVAIFLTRLPSHGRETAAHLRSVPATRGIPIVFVEGEPEKIARVREAVPDAIFTTAGDLPDLLDGLQG